VNILTRVPKWLTFIGVPPEKAGCHPAKKRGRISTIRESNQPEKVPQVWIYAIKNSSITSLPTLRGLTGVISVSKLIYRIFESIAQ
jgi:hypothetical protein